RHTRFSRDWSSDVCSSDLLHIPNFAHGALYMVGGYITLMMMTHAGLHYVLAIFISVIVVGLLAVLMERVVFYPLRNTPPLQDKRSEERRVGTACRCGWLGG